MTVLIDSDILIEVSRGRDAGIISRWSALAESGAAILCSPVTVAELWTGARPSEHHVLIDLFRVLNCVPIDAGIGRRAGDYLNRYRKSHGLELGDAMIAATAVVHEAALWTRNRKHYPIPGLQFY